MDAKLIFILKNLVLNKILNKKKWFSFKNSSPFLELSQLAANNVYGNDEILSAGIVSGIGTICG